MGRKDIKPEASTTSTPKESAKKPRTKTENERLEPSNLFVYGAAICSVEVLLLAAAAASNGGRELVWGKQLGPWFRWATAQVAACVFRYHRGRRRRRPPSQPPRLLRSLNPERGRGRNGSHCRIVENKHTRRHSWGCPSKFPFSPPAPHQSLSGILYIRFCCFLVCSDRGRLGWLICILLF